MNAVIDTINFATSLTPVNIEQDIQLRQEILKADVELIVDKVINEFAHENLKTAVTFLDAPIKEGAVLDILMIEDSEARQKKVFELDEFIYGDMFELLDYLEAEYGFAEEHYLSAYQQKMTSDLVEQWQSKGYNTRDNVEQLAALVSGYQANLSKFIQGITARDEIVQAFAHQGIFEVKRHIDQDPEWYCPCEVIELYCEQGAIIVHQAFGFSRNITVSAELTNSNFDVMFKFNKHHNPYNKARALAQLIKEG